MADGEWFQEDFGKVLNERRVWPWKEHFQQQKVFVTEPHYSQILGFLEAKRCCLIEGAAGYGKTILALLVGREYYYTRNLVVIQIDTPKIPPDKEAIAIARVEVMGNTETLFLIEDSHIKPRVTDEILKRAERAARARFLFTMRTPRKPQRGIKIDDPFEGSTLRQQDLVVRLGKVDTDIENAIKGVTKKFWATYSGELSQKNKVFPSAEDYQYLFKETRGNLRFVLYCLETWKDLEQPLSLREVSREQVVNKFRKDTWELLNINQKEVYKTMAPLGQFEIPILPNALFPFPLDKSKTSLEAAGRALEEDDPSTGTISLRAKKLASKAGDYWMLADTESQLALELQKNVVPKHFDFNVLRTYILSDYATNYWQVFHSLHRAQERGLLIRLAQDADVFSSLTSRLGEAETPLDEILYVLRAIAWADKDEGLRLWDEYKNILNGNSLTEIQRKLANQIGITTLLFLFLKNIDREDEAIPLTKELPVEVFIEQLKVASFTSVANEVNLFYSLVPDKTKQILKGLSESDYVRFGKEARHRNFQSIEWFLRILASDEGLKDFADSFLKAIGQDALRDMANLSSLRTIKRVRQFLNKLNTDTAREFKESLKRTLSEEELIEEWANETVEMQSRRLWQCARTFKPVIRQRGKNLVKRLAEIDKPLRLGEAEEAEPVDKLNWLLYSAYWLDEDTAKSLALKAVGAFDAESMQYSLEHFAHLLKNARSCSPTASHQLVDKIFESDAASLLSKGELNWFSQLIWKAVVSNELRTREWVAGTGENFWVNLAANANPPDAFRLLLVLWQANEEVGKRVIQAVGQQMIALPKLKDQPEAMPFLGLFAFCGLKPCVALSFSPAENISELYVHPPIRRLACSLFYLQASKLEAIPSFIRAALTHKGIAPNFALLLAKYRLPWAASTLQDILASPKSESREEKIDIYDRMLLHFISIQPRRVYFGTMFNEIRSPQFMQQEELSIVSTEETEREEERRRSRAAIWLNKAIDKEIFTVEAKEHPVTHKASRILDLNRRSPEVGFAIDVASSLLIALNNAQRDKEWVSGNAWDDALFVRYMERGSLAPSQMEYWKGILLKMGVIKADYQKTDAGEWIVTFCLDSTHPLVKVLI